MSQYSHLSLIEREELYALKVSRLSIREIGRRLDRSPSTISRELKRNTKYGKKYVPCLAQGRYTRVSERQRYLAPLKSPKVLVYVRDHLRDDWSPETIAGRLSQDIEGASIGVETIYRYAYSNLARRDRLWEYLALHRKRRLKKNGRKVKSTKIANRTLIDSRAKYIEKRRQPGHWETDLMEGKRSDHVAVSATVERTSRVSVLAKVNSKKAHEKARVLKQDLGRLPAHLCRTLTADNGSENANHQEISTSLGVKVYFCHPYASWEKGSVENLIGRIRRYLPKGMSLDNLTDEELAAIEYRLNTTPRKCLGFLTPYEKMSELQKKFRAS